MSKMRRALVSDRTQAAHANSVRGAVRRALRLSTGVIAAGLTLGSAPIACAAPFPAILQLASLLPDNGGDGSTGFVLRGIAPGDRSGFSVSNAGDVNADGIDDLIIGAPYASHDEQAGQSYVVFGRNTAQTGMFPALYPRASVLTDGGGEGSGNSHRRLQYRNVPRALPTRESAS